MRNKVIPAVLALCASMTPVHAAASPMQSYEVQLPGHVFQVSLPPEVVQQGWAVKHTPSLDLNNASFIKAGFYDVFEVAYDLNGPFWVGAYGVLKINIIVQKREADIAGDITTIGGLERYLRGWEMKVARPGDPECVFNLDSLNGMPAVRRNENTFKSPGDAGPFDRVIYSFPLNAEMFLNVGFTVKGWKDEPGKEAKWRPKAEAIRDLVKTTVKLRSAPTR